MLLNLNQITVQVLDVEKSIAFYEKLGLRLIVKNLPSYARFECEAGDTTFSLHQTSEIKNETGAWIYFETENLQETINNLLAQGIFFEEMPTEQTWLWTEARLKDLDNNQIIIYHAGANRKNPPWRVN